MVWGQTAPGEPAALIATAYNQLRASQNALADIVDSVIQQFQSQLREGGIGRLREGLASIVLSGIDGERSPGKLMEDLAQAFILFEADPAGAQRLAEDCALMLKPYLGTAATEPGSIIWWLLAQRLLAMYLEAFPERGSQAHHSEIATWFRNQLLHAFERSIENEEVKLEPIGDRESLKRDQLFYLKSGPDGVQVAMFLQKYWTDTGGGADMYSFRTIAAHGIGEINSDDGEYNPRLEDEIGFRIIPPAAAGKLQNSAQSLPPLLPTPATGQGLLRAA